MHTQLICSESRVGSPSYVLLCLNAAAAATSAWLGTSAMLLAGHQWHGTSAWPHVVIHDCALVQ